MNIELTTEEYMELNNLISFHLENLSEDEDIDEEDIDLNNLISFHLENLSEYEDIDDEDDEDYQRFLVVKSLSEKI